MLMIITVGSTIIHMNMKVGGGPMAGYERLKVERFKLNLHGQRRTCDYINDFVVGTVINPVRCFDCDSPHGNLNHAKSAGMEIMGFRRLPGAVEAIIRLNPAVMWRIEFAGRVCHGQAG